MFASFVLLSASGFTTRYVSSHVSSRAFRTSLMVQESTEPVTNAPPPKPNLASMADTILPSATAPENRPAAARPVPYAGAMLAPKDLSAAAAQKRIKKQVDEEETNKGFAMTKAMFAEGWARAGDEALGSAALGPPFTEPTGAGWPTSKEPKNKADMVALANKLNPVVGFWDPLQIIKDDTPPEQIGWWRHAEIKHGRIAMAAFVGYMAHANGIHFPWSIQEPLKLWGSESPLASLPSITFADIAAAGSPGDMWDAVPTAGKAQIFAVIAFLEAFGETSVALEADGQKHYVRGGKPGYYPSFQGRFPHAVPFDLFDPFKLFSKMSPERREEGLRAELNNGRLAMIGIFGLISASKGLNVPGLNQLGLAQYSGEYMAPFTAADNLPFVKQMAANIGSYGW
jgi:hypothetical protein